MEATTIIFIVAILATFGILIFASLVAWGIGN
jgi:hypothetical protein